MKTNVGKIDRWVRIIVGVVALGLVVFSLSSMATWWWWVLLVVGVILLATASVKWCPIWAALGISTQSKT
jgi:Inner membrane protein YgaP-like, transmembrane domain